MDLHQRQQFDFLLQTATERFVERLEQRLGGPGPALDRLRIDPEGAGVWIGQFVIAVFADFLLDNPEGSCFVLQALARRRVVAPPAGDVASMLGTLAHAAFQDLLRQKTVEALEQRQGYQAVQPPGD